MKNKEQVNKEFDDKFNLLYVEGTENILDFISSIRQNDVDELIEVLKIKELKPPHEEKDFEKEEDGKLSNASIRNTFKYLENHRDIEYRGGYNKALFDIITHLTSIKEKI